jgi:hypothetical protein
MWDPVSLAPVSLAPGPRPLHQYLDFLDRFFSLAAAC